MSIPIQTVVKVNLTIGAQFPSRPGFGTALVVYPDGNLIDTPIDPIDRLLFVSTIDEVTDAGFLTSDEVYKAANTYFSQSPKPDSIDLYRS